MRRVLLTLVIVFATLVGVALAAVLLAESEWAERRLEEYLSGRLDRTVELEDIDVRFAWPPRVELGILRIGNPEWAHTAQLIDAADLAATIEFWPLLDGRLVLDRLAVRRAVAGLERSGERVTWRFAQEPETGQTAAQARYELQEVQVESATIHYRNEPENTVLEVHAQGSLGGAAPVQMRASGRYRGEEAKAHASAPSLLLSADQAIELKFEASVGRTQASAQGTIRSSTAGVQSINTRFSLSGSSLEGLNNIARIDFPGTPPYKLEGRLIHEKQSWRFEDFVGQMGDSDLRGTWSYETGGARPLVRADLTSKMLDLDDLGPLIGAPPATGKGETASPEQKQRAKKRERTGKVLPTQPLGAHRWDAIDVDVQYEAQRIVDAPVPVDQLKVHAVLENGRLHLSPLTLGVAGGEVEGSAALDSREDPLHAAVDLELRSLQLGKLFPEVQSTETALGTLYGRMDLEGRGRSVSAILGTSDGEVSMLVEGGSVSALLIEAMGLDLGEALMVLGTKKKDRVPLNCAVVHLAVDDGAAKTRTFVVDTRDTLITVSGTVYLGKERIDLVATPQARDPSLLAAPTPIVISGTFIDPQVRPKGGPLAARAGAAALLAAVNPLLALLPLIETGTAPESNCSQLLETAKSQKEK